MIKDMNHISTDDHTTYEGFHNVATMPYPVSDHTTVVYDIDFNDEQGPRIYIVGGCIQDQDCSAGTTLCYCPTITNKCIYFTPEVFISLSIYDKEHYS